MSRDQLGEAGEAGEAEEAEPFPNASLPPLPSLPLLHREHDVSVHHTVTFKHATIVSELNSWRLRRPLFRFEIIPRAGAYRLGRHDLGKTPDVCVVCAHCVVVVLAGGG